MISKATDDSFYARFEQQLEDSQSWPGRYFFKFIVKTEANTIPQIKSLFDAYDAQFAVKDSSKSTYKSLSIIVHLNSPKEVIQQYKKVMGIEGVIAL